jgi:hypothetical protein
VEAARSLAQILISEHSASKWSLSHFQGSALYGVQLPCKEITNRRTQMIRPPAYQINPRCGISIHSKARCTKCLYLLERYLAYVPGNLLHKKVRHPPEHLTNRPTTAEDQPKWDHRPNPSKRQCSLNFVKTISMKLSQIINRMPALCSPHSGAFRPSDAELKAH